ncbi:hypothetical protein FRB94_002680 [Tulasnella sp. JGI-2019a]|nr:hypothetical protein FRB94_002680 [Tulasnella sp. JGI-2019a]
MQKGRSTQLGHAAVNKRNVRHASASLQAPLHLSFSALPSPIILLDNVFILLENAHSLTSIIMNDENVTTFRSLAEVQATLRLITSDFEPIDDYANLNLIGPESLQQYQDMPLSTPTSPTTTLAASSPSSFFSEIGSPPPSPPSLSPPPYKPRTFHEYASTPGTKPLTTIESIRAALMETLEWKATSNDICQIISHHDERYQTPERFGSLCSNVRQRLSQTEWFQLAERPVGQKGKARYWMYVENLDETYINWPRSRSTSGSRRSRRSSNDSIRKSARMRGESSSSPLQHDPAITPPESIATATFGASSLPAPNQYIPHSIHPLVPLTGAEPSTPALFVQGPLAQPIPTSMTCHTGTDGFGGIQNVIQPTPPPSLPSVTEVIMPAMDVASASALTMDEVTAMFQQYLDPECYQQ